MKQYREITKEEFLRRWKKHKAQKTQKPVENRDLYGRDFYSTDEIEIRESEARMYLADLARNLGGY